jgi:hypothetical protein
MYFETCNKGSNYRIYLHLLKKGGKIKEEGKPSLYSVMERKFIEEMSNKFACIFIKYNSVFDYNYLRKTILSFTLKDHPSQHLHL